MFVQAALLNSTMGFGDFVNLGGICWGLWDLLGFGGFLGFGVLEDFGDFGDLDDCNALSQNGYGDALERFLTKVQIQGDTWR